MNNNLNYSYGGFIQQNIALVKYGTGRQELRANNTYVGSTLVNDGELLLTSGRLSQTSAVTVNGGGELTVTGGPLSNLDQINNFAGVFLSNSNVRDLAVFTMENTLTPEHAAAIAQLDETAGLFTLGGRRSSTSARAGLVRSCVLPTAAARPGAAPRSRSGTGVATTC